MVTAPLQSVGVEAVEKAISDLLRPLQRETSDWWYAPACIRRGDSAHGRLSKGMRR